MSTVSTIDHRLSTDMSTKQQICDLFARLSYREGEFRLSSGKMSSFYLDAKKVTYHSDGVKLVGNSVLDILDKHKVDAVGGLTMGADAIVVSTVWASVERGQPISGFIVRKEKKEHGTSRQIEGVIPEGKRVAIVEDVITTGESAIKAIEAVRAVGSTVAVVVAMVDREEGGRAAIEALGIPLEPVCTIAEVRASYRSI